MSAFAARDKWLMAIAGVAACVAITIVIYRPWDLRDGFMIGAPVGRDFANFWLGGHLAITGRLDLLVDYNGYNARFQQIFVHNPAEHFVFSYPPHMLLLLAPFGALPFVPADILWLAINVACSALTAWLLLRKQSASAYDRALLVLLTLVSPAILTMLAFGHFGGMLGLAATLALLRGERSPLLAGICLSLTTVKPQFALVLALMLLLSGRWRVVMWSVPATLVLLAVSAVAFDVQPWIDFLSWTVPLHSRLLSEFHIEALRTAISLYAGLRMIGVPGAPAMAAQFAFAALVLLRAVMLVRRRGFDASTVVLALMAALIALPYFNGYDLAIAAPALCVALFQDRPPHGSPVMGLMPAMLLWLAPVFALPFGLLEIPAVPFAVAGAFVWALFIYGDRREGRLSAAPAEGPSSL